MLLFGRGGAGPCEARVPLLAALPLRRADQGGCGQPESGDRPAVLALCRAGAGGPEPVGAAPQGVLSVEQDGSLLTGDGAIATRSGRSSMCGRTRGRSPRMCCPRTRRGSSARWCSGGGARGRGGGDRRPAEAELAGRGLGGDPARAVARELLSSRGSTRGWRWTSSRWTRRSRRRTCVTPSTACCRPRSCASQAREQASKEGNTLLSDTAGRVLPHRSDLE